VVQSSHAALELARWYKDFEVHPNVIVCGIKNKEKLTKLFIEYQKLGIKCEPFFENDLDDELTAFATIPVYGKQRELFRKLQLIKEPSKRQQEE
jgi:hypothetical protein